MRYLHSDVETVERVEIIRDLRLGVFDVLVGINLLREGLDIPEVALVAILDADKEGFLRSERSLIQTVGRAARHIDGRAILYGDRITRSMERAIQETTRRRDKQIAFNRQHGIIPRGVIKQVKEMIDGVYDATQGRDALKAAEQATRYEALGEKSAARELKRLEKVMLEHARNLEFEKAAQVRDQLAQLKEQLFGASGVASEVTAAALARMPGAGRDDELAVVMLGFGWGLVEIGSRQGRYSRCEAADGSVLRLCRNRRIDFRASQGLVHKDREA